MFAELVNHESTEFHRSNSSIWLKKNGVRFCTPTHRKMREGWGVPCPSCVGEDQKSKAGPPVLDPTPSHRLIVLGILHVWRE